MRLFLFQIVQEALEIKMKKRTTACESLAAEVLISDGEVKNATSVEELILSLDGKLRGQSPA